MKVIRVVMMTGLLGSAGLGAVAEPEAKPIPVKEFGKKAAISSLSLSNEGDFLVGLITLPNTKQEETALAVWELGESIDISKPLIPTRATPANDRMEFVAASAIGGDKIRVLGKQAWTGQTYCIEGGGAGAVKTWIYKTYFGDKNIKPQELDDDFANLADDKNECARLSGEITVAESLPLDPEHVIASAYDVDAQAPKYYKVNLATESKEFLYQDSGNLQNGYIDPRTGNVLTKFELEPIGGNDYEVRTYILNAQTGTYDLEAPLTYTAAARYQVDTVGHDEQSGKYYVITDRFSDKASVYLYDPVADKFSEGPLFAHPEFSASGVILGRNQDNFNIPLGFTYDGLVQETYWVDPEMRSVQDGLESIFPGLMVDVMDWNEDRSRILFSTEESNSPPTYYLLVDKSKLAVIGSSRPWFSDYQMSKSKLVYYDARDGLEIPAILTPAVGWEKGDAPRPTIIHPHGGPWARDFGGWDSSGWVQFLTSRGYHVLQPQYRGSQGFGRELWLAGDNEWGQKMQDDKDDGAAWLVSEGYADPDRIAIFGYSYGGFAAFAATVRENGPYQCAIAGAGVSNLALFRTKVSENRISRAVQGHTMTGMDPLANSDHAVLPILVYHGDRDVRVPIKDGRDFYNAVKNKVPAKFLSMKDMGHQGVLWSPENHRESLEAIDDFLRNDCGPGGL